MSYRFLSLVTPAIEHPVTKEEAKTHLRVRASSEDTYISDLIAVAFSMLERHTGRALVTQTWDFKTGAPGGEIALPLAPVASLVSMSYYDTDDVSQDLSLDDFYLFSDADKAVIAPKSDVIWPVMKARPDALSIRFVSGYGAPSAVPRPLKQAVLMLVGHWYSTRAAVVRDGTAMPVPLGYNFLIADFRRGWIG